MKMGIGVACMSASLFAAGDGVRAEDIHRSEACRFELLGSGKVTRVVDGRSVMLEDGREVQISGVEVPPASQQLAGSAKAALEALLLGEVVELRGFQDVTDRYGRTVSFVVRQDGAID